MNVVSNCQLCEEHSLHVYGENNAQLMQCISCGYTSTSNFIGEVSKNEEYKKLNNDMKKWSKVTDNRFWIPTIMTLPTGMLYPVNKDEVMTWAFAPMVDISEEEQRNYPDGNGSYYKQRYDTDKQNIFDSFVDAMLFLTNTDKQVEHGQP